MAQVVEWKDTEDEQITKYTYDKQGCLVKEEYKKGEGPAIYAYNYTYDQQGYMIQKEEVALKPITTFQSCRQDIPSSATSTDT